MTNIPPTGSMTPSRRSASRFGTAAVLAGVAFTCVPGVQALGQSTASAATATATRPVFGAPYDGDRAFLKCAPTRATSAAQINERLGQKRADAIARCLGMVKRDVFTPRQFRMFVTGRSATPIANSKAYTATVDASVKILTNTRTNPYYVETGGTVQPVSLGSYGLYVQRVRRTTHKNGTVTTVKIPPTLMSPANEVAPPLKFNVIITPVTGYLSTWCKANGATASLEMLYRSAFWREAGYSLKAQALQDPADLATLPGTQEHVGMSMVPALWNINFTLIYTLNPAAAANMPAYWAPIPAAVARGISQSRNGRVPWAEYSGYFG